MGQILLQKQHSKIKKSKEKSKMLVATAGKLVALALRKGGKNESKHKRTNKSLDYRNMRSHRDFVGNDKKFGLSFKKSNF